MKKLIVILVIVLNTIILFSAEKTIKFEGREANNLYTEIISANRDGLPPSIERLKERNTLAALYLNAIASKYLKPSYDENYYGCLNTIKQEISKSKYADDIKEFEINDYCFWSFNLWGWGSPDEIYITLKDDRVSKITCTQYGFSGDKTFKFWINFHPKFINKINIHLSSTKYYDNTWTRKDFTWMEFLLKK
jgi:hypothetical protein